MNYIIITIYYLLGWTLVQILYVEVNINKFSPLKGSSYIKLPKCLEMKRSIINVKNDDHYCFAWAIVSALFPARKPEVALYPHFNTVLNLNGLSFPMKLKDIPKFEEINDISINVYGVETVFVDGKVNYEVNGPLHYTKSKRDLHINLLLLTNENGGAHYCWIKSMSRLLSSQISSHEHKTEFCDGCLLHFNTAEAVMKHQNQGCNYTATTIPSTNMRTNKLGQLVSENILKFENLEKQLKVPFVVFADFESILTPISTCEPNPEHSYTYQTSRHEAYSCAYYIKCSYNEEKSKFMQYRGKDAVQIFLNRLEADLKEIYNKYLNIVIPMKPLTPEQDVEFMNSSACYICKRKYNDNDVKVRDHCHLTGNYRGSAHSICNLNYKLPSYIPIIFHNMSGYDCHLFIKQLCTYGEKVDVVAQTKENYISFTKTLCMGLGCDNAGNKKNKFLQLRFIDSFRFLSTSLEVLAKGLSENEFIETKKHFPNKEEFDLIRQKGVFPYSFVDNLNKLDSPYLPCRKDFYDKLTDEEISEEDYKRAEKVWSTFSCGTLGEYSDIYLKSDVLLLCDVFENFREKCLEKYNLDPAHYMSIPGLSWDSMLKTTGIELELLTDVDMIHFLKNSIRGGISQCSHRMYTSNNRYLPNFNPNEKQSFISYLDATNLYGFSMTQQLPVGEFVWLTEGEIENFDVLSIPDESEYGYILEVDVEYPKALHDLHSDLPFLVENIVPPISKTNTKKLIPNLYDKEKYTTHYKNLKQALRYGLVLRTVHRVLKFKQSRWLKSYIDMNTEMRNKSKTKFEKDLYKLMNNAIYGKTMENVERRKDIKLVTHWENIGKRIGAEALIAHPNFKDCSIFHEDFVAVHMNKVKIHYNKPIYLGFSILELSKTVLYEFFYGVIKQRFKESATLLYTDTDSVIIGVECEDFYQFIKENIEHFDTSNYKEGNKLQIPVTPSVLGKMKDEFPDDPIISFYGTGAKAYCVVSVESELKKAKGVKRSVIKKQITPNDYKKVILDGGTIHRKMNAFRSISHDIYTEIRNKVALSHHDDKRFIIPNTVRTLPWGHQDTPLYKSAVEGDLNMLVDMMKVIVEEQDLVEEVGVMRNTLNQTENNILDTALETVGNEISNEEQDLGEEVVIMRNALSQSENSILDRSLDILAHDCLFESV